MNNLKQRGDIVTLVAPTGGVTTGLGVLIGQIFAVPVVTAAATVSFAARIAGVVELVKISGTAWTEGQLLYWDDSASNVTTVSAGNTLIGTAAILAASGAVVGNVLLNKAVSSDGPGSNIMKGEDLGAPDVLDDNYFLISTVMLATAYVLDQTALAADNPPRNVIVTHTTDTTTDTLGDAVVVGTDVEDEVITETITVSADGVATGTKAFKTITSVTTATWVQLGGVSDLIEVGFGHLLGLSEVRASTDEIFMGTLDGLMRDFDTKAIDADNVEGNTVSLNGGTYNSTKEAKVLIKL